MRTVSERAADHTKVAAALATLGRLIAAVTTPGKENSEFDSALNVLANLSRKEGIAIAIVGGMAAIKYGYHRYTKDIDVVVAHQHLDTLLRVAPKYGIKVVWHDPHGWHKLSFEGVRIEVVPEGARASKDAPTTIPGPGQLGVHAGSEYASLEGWVETKLSSARSQDRADVIQVLKRLDSEAVTKTRDHLAGVHLDYLRFFDELQRAAEEEKQQEMERGGQR